ncbi:CYT2 [Malassezia furfur]|nr:CYT2 [Malassezia furfur]
MWPFSSSAKAAPAQPSGCPVDHETRHKWKENVGCPVDHETQAAYLEQAKEAKATGTSEGAPHLSTEREVSSIPRHYMGSVGKEDSAHTDADELGEQDKKWVYPSPMQFYSAVRRKNHDARAEDMDVVVPIHNAVNEQAWHMIREWEKNWNEPGASEPELVNFVGRPRDYTWRAWMRSIAGYQLPFDRHDWIVVRPDATGEPKTMRYIIDFYAGRNPSQTSSDAMMKASDPKNKISFYLDVRPAPDTFEGIAMRLHRWWLPPKTSTS